MIFTFISGITTSSQTELLRLFLIDFSFYTFLAGLVGCMLFRNERKKYLSKILMVLMTLASFVFLVLQFN
ncbi:hypothetical protein [uncultured Draconibacterium sp.]|uniref:hypothetical protein n=1 Tax=uncultured Draconibacterium sp. TaxID=1573823 RepID=UPI0025D330C7|nr:hypothetical protein [uncultured Draconibacterium sp.]